MSVPSLSLAFAQINPTVGDVAGNVAMIRAARAQAQGADLLITPEMALSGYPPEDLILKPDFLRDCAAALDELARDTADGGPGLVIGAPVCDDDPAFGDDKNAFVQAASPLGSPVYNAAALLSGGRCVGWRGKQRLCNYGVFDEARIFSPAPAAGPLSFRGVSLGLLICEDLWQSHVCAGLVAGGAEILLCLNGSPWHEEQGAQRAQVAQARVREGGRPLAYVNMVGGQDDLVFDGASFVLNSDGAYAFAAPAFEQGVFRTDWVKDSDRWSCQVSTSKNLQPRRLGRQTVFCDPQIPQYSAVLENSFPASQQRLEVFRDTQVVTRPRAELTAEAALYSALVLGLRDYLDKNGFSSVVIGMSGGIDSALSAAIAVDACGPEAVRLVMMASPYTSADSLDCASRAAQMLGVRYDSLSIASAMTTFDDLLAPLFGGAAPDITEENIQARTRGLLLMALSNKFGSLLLSTGNKSEMAVGYATLYGDMCGGFSVLKDVYKTRVFDLARWRNALCPDEGGFLRNFLRGPQGPVMPETIITRPPSAELRPYQTDQDSLPDYAVLDAILARLIEGEEATEQIVAAGFEAATVRRVQALLRGAEYKRRQSVPGVKVTSRDLARDRRYPLTNRYRG